MTGGGGRASAWLAIPTVPAGTSAAELPALKQGPGFRLLLWGEGGGNISTVSQHRRCNKEEGEREREREREKSRSKEG